MFGYAQEVFNRVMMAETFLKGCTLNNLDIGIAWTLLMYLMPIIDKFKESHPTVQVTIHEGPSIILREELADFKHDICLIGSIGVSGFDERLRVLRIPEVERMVFVASPQHALAKASTVKWEDLARYPFIAQHKGSMAREVLNQHFKERGLKPSIGTEVDNLECIKGLAREMRGIALMFLPNIQDDLALGRLKIIPLLDGEIKLGIDIVMNKELAMSPALEAFLKVIQEYFHGDPYQISST